MATVPIAGTAETTTRTARSVTFFLTDRSGWSGGCFAAMRYARTSFRKSPTFYNLTTSASWRKKSSPYRYRHNGRSAQMRGRLSAFPNSQPPTAMFQTTYGVTNTSRAATSNFRHTDGRGTSGAATSRVPTSAVTDWTRRTTARPSSTFAASTQSCCNTLTGDSVSYCYRTMWRCRRCP